MSIIKNILNDFLKTALIVWLLLLLMELVNAGMVERFINLEIYFYILVAVYIFNKIISR